MSLRHRLAARAPVPVFVAAGAGAGLAHVELAADPRLRLVSNPRHATVLLAMGAFPGHLGDALARTHDQLPHLRAVAWWRPEGTEPPPAALVGAVEVAGDHARYVGEVADALSRLHQELLGGEHPSSADVRPDAPPNPFEGRGDHGQGGEGMMGGVPWGRPMAMTGDDRDGLGLDRSAARLGPFLMGLPPATAVDVVLQGGVVQELELVAPPPWPGSLVDPLAQIWPADAEQAALDGTAMENARARHLLRWLAEACRLSGLDALASRAAAAAAGIGAGGTRAEEVRRLARRVRRSGLVRTWRGVGTDVFEDGTDAAGRLAAHLDAAEVAVRRAAVGAQHGTSETGPPWRTVGPSELDEIAGALVGLDWSDALVTLCSLDVMVDPAGERSQVAS